MYGAPVQTKQRRTPKTRGAFAILAAEEIGKVLVSGWTLHSKRSRDIDWLLQTQLPQFPYGLDQIKVLSIDVRSRGTVQARLFVSAEVFAAQTQ